MQMFKDLQTEEGRKKYRADMAAETDSIIAEIRAEREANGGVSSAMRYARSGRRSSYQYQNSNFGMGM